MIIDIENYVRDKFYNTKFGIMKNLEEKSIRTIYNFINKYELGREGLLSNLISGKVNFKQQVGGEIYDIKLKDNKKYYYDVTQITNKQNNKHKICFLNLHDVNNSCLCFTFHSIETGITTIELNDLNANDNCVACLDPTHKFKIGDILMQIFLELIKTNREFRHIKSIKLQGNSTKKCFGYGIQLKYLRTITDGIPYYAKYGFRPSYPSDQQTFRFNREHHEKKIILKSKILIKIFDDLQNMENKNTYNVYKQYLRPQLLLQNKINPAILLRKLMDIENTDLVLENNKKISSLEKNSFCELVNITIKQIFEVCGYKDYYVDLWTLSL